MFVSDNLQVNNKGHLTIGNCDTVELAKKFGTPLYVMDEDKIRDVCKKYQSSFEKYYQGKGTPVYASKAFNCKEICRIVRSEGFDIDVVSGGELYTALKSGVEPDHIHFHGNNKTIDEIRFALQNKVGHIIVDNLTELQNIQQISQEIETVTPVSLRIKPGIDAHTHKFIRTGQIDSKFGFALENGEAMQAVKKAAEYSNISLKGLHCHIGSQIFDISPFVLAAEVMLDFILKIRTETGITISELNLGGGFGIKYVNSDKPVPYDEYMKEVSQAVHKKCSENGIEVPYIYIEPGRSVVGEAGLTLYKVGAVKEIEGVRNYVSIDGGMTDNPRYALYQSAYTVVLANKADKPADYTATIAGKCCESGDLIQENAAISKPVPGDILAVLSTGAYNYSMASNYNRIPRPAVVMIRGGNAREIIRRETYDDLIRNDL